LEIGSFMGSIRTCTIALLAAFSFCAAAGAAHAQEKEVAIKFIPSARFDLIAGKTTAGHAGLSIRTPISNYFAIGATAAAGVSETGFSGRGDLFARFSLDPYHYATWEPYVGVGGTSRLDSGGPGTRSYLLAFVGFEGPSTGRIAPGFELGVGGGVRFGVTLRFTGKSDTTRTRR
jgi:hypothetical protein